MSVDYSQLVPGQEISSRTFVMDGDAVARYKEAVGDTNLVRSADGQQELAPAMAVAHPRGLSFVFRYELSGGRLAPSGRMRR